MHELKQSQLSLLSSHHKRKVYFMSNVKKCVSVPPKMLQPETDGWSCRTPKHQINVLAAVHEAAQANTPLHNSFPFSCSLLACL